ncbi:hypothetical protein Tco_0285975 [Tanacetum coccineum]
MKQTSEADIQSRLLEQTFGPSEGGEEPKETLPKEPPPKKPKLNQKIITSRPVCQAQAAYGDGPLMELLEVTCDTRVNMDDPNITMKEYIRIEEEKSRRRGKVYNWETAKYGKIWDNKDVHNLGSVENEFLAIVFNDMLTSEAALSCEPMVSSLNNDKIDFRISFNESDDEDCTPTVSCFDDLSFFKDFENEFPAIVYNKAPTSKSDLLTEPTVSPQHIDEFNLKDETSFSECDEVEQNVLYFNDLFPFNVIYPDDSKLDKDNDDDKIDIKHSSGGNVINTDDGAYAHGSNKLLETSHDTSNKIFKTETFIKELNFNIMTWNHLNKGMSFIFLIKNLYVPFGIPFNPKVFYKDGIKLRVDVANLARAEPDKCFGEADMSKDTSGLESLEELRRSWYVEGQTRSGVISPVLAQQYQEIVLGSRGANLRTRQP